MKLRHLPLMEPVQPRRLAALANRFPPVDDGADHGAASRPIWPPRDAAQVHAALSRGGRVPVLDLWRLLGDHDWWSARAAMGEAKEAARILWREAPRLPELDAELRWRTILQLSGLPVRLHPSVVQARPRRKHPCDWVFEMASNGSAEAMVNRCLRARTRPSPEEVLRGLGLPTRLPVLAGLPSVAVDRLLETPTVGVSTWVLGRITTAPSATRDALFARVLDHLTADQLHDLPHLRAALLAWSAQGRAQVELSPRARRRLQALHGQASWDEVIAAIEGLVEHTVDDLNDLVGRFDVTDHEKEARWALQRAEIWSNYSARMTASRVFIRLRDRPHFLRNGALPSNIEVHAAPPVAVMAFESEQLVCIQALVGAGSAEFYRPLPSSGEPVLAPVMLRRSAPSLGKVATWGHLWQWHLYDTIRSHGLQPNEGLQSFRYPRRHLDRSTGLPRKPKIEPKPAQSKSKFTGSKTAGASKRPKKTTQKTTQKRPNKPKNRGGR